MSMVIFDLDSTIADSPYLIVTSYNDWASRRGYKEISAAEFEFYSSCTILERMRLMGIPFYRQFVSKHRLPHIGLIEGNARLFGKSTRLTRLSRTLHIKAEDTLYVGDERRDIEACRKAGFRRIAVSWGYDASELLANEKPDYLVHRADELSRLLRKVLYSGGEPL